MQESLVFNYDGQSSKKFGVYLAQVGGGLYNEPFLPTRKITEKKIASREKPYFQSIEQEPLQFKMNIVFEEWDLKDIKRQVARWLFQDYYKPLYFESNPNRIFYAIIEGSSELIHNGVTDYNGAHAYITVNVRCDSPYAYTPEYPLSSIKFEDGNKTQIIHDRGLALTDGSLQNLKYNTQNQSLSLEKGIETLGEFFNMYTTWGEVFNA